MSAPAKTWREWAADTSIDFWDVRENAETLTHEALEEAVESYVDDNAHGVMEAWVRERFPGGMKVYGHRRNLVDPDWLTGQAEWLAEAFGEHLGDEYGDPDGNYDMLSAEQEAALAAAIARALEELRPKLEPWQCERVVTVTIPLDELLALLRECRPDWFEVTP